MDVNGYPPLANNSFIPGRNAAVFSNVQFYESYENAAYQQPVYQYHPHIEQIGGFGQNSGLSAFLGSKRLVKPKEPYMVARRNARERRRVQQVNDGFLRLRSLVPMAPKGKKLSKVKTLRAAIEYIGKLQDILREGGEGAAETKAAPSSVARPKVNEKEKGREEEDIDWLPLHVVSKEEDDFLDELLGSEIMSCTDI